MRSKFIHKLLIMPMLATLALFVLFFISQYFMRTNNTLLVDVEGHFVPALELGRDLQEQLKELQWSMQNAVAVADDMELEEADQFYQQFLELLEQGRANLFFTSGEMDELHQRFQEYYTLAREISVYLIEGGSLDEQTLENLAVMREQYNTIKTRLTFQTEQAKAQVSVAFSTAVENSAASARYMNLIIVGYIGVFVLVSVLLSRSITQPLHTLMRATSAIAKGDLSHQITVRSRDEFGVLGSAMERMRVELQQFYLKLEHLVVERTQALQESEARFRNVIASISDHIYVGELPQDGHWQSRYHSPNVKQLTGYQPEQFLTNPELWFTLIHADDIPAANAQVERFAQGRNSETEYRLTHKNGSIIWVRDNARVEPHTERNSTMIYGVVSDVTQRKQAEEHQRHLQTRLRQAQKLEAIGKLAGGTAHEFNNVLAIILGSLELVIDDLPESDPNKKRLQEAYKAGERGGELVKEILVFSRSSRQMLEPISLTPLVEEALRLVQPIFPAAVHLHQKLQPDCPPVVTNALQIQQIITNLCQNALQAIESQQGNITVTVHSIEYPTPPSHFPHLAPGRYVRMTVQDTGKGMAPDIKERIFDPFFSTKDVGKGSGLGLSVVHGIVQQAGAAIAVESEPGQGSLFEIVFPVVNTPLPEEIPRRAPVSKHTRKSKLVPANKHVLLVDNNLQLLKLPTVALKRLGYTVTALNDGLQAFELFREHPQRFDVVITDLGLPGMTGLELCQAIQNIRADIPVILCSGSGEELDAHMMERAGVTRSLHKPVKIRELTQILRAVFI